MVGRTAYTKTRLVNGQYELTSSLRPLHWFDASDGGRFKEFQNALRPATGGARWSFEAEPGPYKVAFGAPSEISSGGTMLQVTSGEQSISMSAPGASPRGVSRSGTKVVFEDAYPNGVDIRESISNERIKEEIALPTAPAPGDTLEYSFDLTLGGLTARKNADNSITFNDTTGKAVFRIPRPVMYDSNHANPERQYSDAIGVSLVELSTNRVRLTLTPDAAWVRDPSRVYPLYIDPSVESVIYNPGGTAAQDAPVYEANPTLNYGQQPVLDVGRRSDGLRRDTMIQFPELDALPQDSIVTSATLKLYSSTGSAGVPMEVYANHTAWDEGTVPWANAPTPGADAPVHTRLNSVTPGWNNYYLNGLVRHWVSGRLGNRGMRIMSPGALAGQSAQFHSANSTDPAFHPQLVVRYVPATRYGTDDLWTYTDHDFGGGNKGGVNVSTGNMVLQHQSGWTDVKGFSLEFKHIYSSQDPYGQTPYYDQAGAWYGEGWSFSQLVRLYTLADGAVVIRDGDGGDRIYAKNTVQGTTQTYFQPPDYPVNLTKDLSKPTTDPQVYTLTPQEHGDTLYFDGYGKLTKRQNPYGEFLTYGYDASGRLTSIVDMDGRTVVSFRYEGPGNPARLLEMSDLTKAPAQVSTYGYDTKGNLTRITHDVGTAQAASTTFTYGISHHMLTVTPPEGAASSLYYRTERHWDTAGNVQGFVAEGQATGVAQSVAESFRGSGSLKVDIGGLTNANIASASQTYATPVTWNATQQELLGYVLVPGTAQLDARLALKDSRGKQQYGPWWPVTPSMWTEVRLPDAHVDPGYKIAKVGVELRASAGAASYTGSVWVDHLLVRGLTESTFEMTSTPSITTSFRYDWNTKRTTVTMPGETGALEDIRYDYNKLGQVTAQDVPSAMGKEFTRAEMDAALAYWTPERMAAAEPTPLGGGGTQGPGAEGVSPEPLLPTNCFPIEDSATVSYDGCDRGLTEAIDPNATTASTENYYCNDQPERSIFSWGCLMQTPGDGTSRYEKPYNYNGRLFFKFGARDSYCSATVVNTSRYYDNEYYPGNKSTIWTAGHCLHKGKGSGFMDKVVFAPGFRWGEDPHWGGKWAARALFAPKWRQYGSTDDNRFHFDWGAAVLELKGGTIQSRLLGGSGLQIGGALEVGRTKIRAIGYPIFPGPFGTPPFHDGSKQWWCRGGISGMYDPRTDSPNPGPLMRTMGCEMTEGSSGGGWFANWSETKGGYLRSVVSIQPSVNNAYYKLAGPVFNRDALNLWKLVRDLRTRE